MSVELPPEQFRGEGCDHRADMYALGATLFELLTGRPPFEASTLPMLMIATCTEPVSFPPDVALPGRLQKLLLRLLAKDAADRPSSYEEIAQELDAIARPQPPRAPAFARTVASFGDLVIAVVVVDLVSRLGLPRVAAWSLVALAFAAVEWRWQFTPGKRAMKLVLVDELGSRPQAARMLARAAARLLVPVVALRTLSLSATGGERWIRKVGTTEHFFTLSGDYAFGPIALAGLALVTTMVFAAFVAFGRERRTLLDRLTGTTEVINVK